jgi:hypothetical protein
MAALQLVAQTGQNAPLSHAQLAGKRLLIMLPHYVQRALVELPIRPLVA